MKASLDAGRLREIVQGVIREFVGDRSAFVGRVERVRIAADDDLAGFVADLQRRLSDPGFALRLQLGQHRFVLDNTSRGDGSEVSEPAAVEALQGVVTESRLTALAGSGDTLRLAPGATLTPLARDKARALGIKIERAKECSRRR